MLEEYAQRLGPDVSAEEVRLDAVDDLVDKEPVLVLVGGRLEFGLELILHVASNPDLVLLIKHLMRVASTIQLLEVRYDYARK